jgi:BirA family biotin operon repressor/biotin-[acetyl-CoA-carboxylase] ligase
MDHSSLDTALADINLPAVRFFQSLDSTNDEAWRWFEVGAPHCALVVADAQTSGRGRFHRQWVTVKESGLAFSILLSFPPLNQKYVNRLIGLGALAVCKTLQDIYHLPARIKWPNDILLYLRKVAGVLVETRWEGEQLIAAVMGIGINIAPPSINPDNLPSEGLAFPATCVENELGDKVDRVELLHAILNTLLGLLPELSSVSIMNMWESSLSFLNQWVELSNDRTIHHSGLEVLSPKVQVAKVLGLGPDGSLKLVTISGEVLKVPVGEIHVNPFLGDISSKELDNI